MDANELRVRLDNEIIRFISVKKFSLNIYVHFQSNKCENYKINQTNKKHLNYKFVCNLCKESQNHVSNHMQNKL